MPVLKNVEGKATIEKPSKVLEGKFLNNWYIGNLKFVNKDISD